MTDKPHELQEQSNIETLFHDIATPLLISKMKAEFLIEYLPSLIDEIVGSPELQYLLPKDEKVVDALRSAPGIMLSNLGVVQKKINLLSSSMLHQANNFSLGKSGEELVGGSYGISPVRSVSIKTVLLVDDETIHRDIGESLLSPLYDVDFAKNGLEAISMCEQKHYDLILMDLHMPKMNGEQATIALRTRVSDETIIIGLTSLPIGVNRSGLTAMGFTDFLEKPLTLKSLQKLLRTHSLNA